MAEALIELEIIKAIQESICEFLLDEVINPKGEFYADPRISRTFCNLALFSKDFHI